MPQERPENNFGIAFFLTVAIAIATGVFILINGKSDSFLIINGINNSYADLFFKYFTHAADGWLWAVLALYCFFYKKKYLVAVIAGAIISTLLAQFMKRVIFPEEMRPIAFLTESFPVHVIEGLKMRRLHSFPSGHTSAAFTAALIIAHMINKKTWSVILPLIALLAGYSRVYLGQHFLTDVFAGICIGIVSGFLSLLVYRSFIKNLNKTSLK